MVPLQHKVESESEDEDVVDVEDIGQMITQSNPHRRSNREKKKKSKTEIQLEEDNSEDDTQEHNSVDGSREMVTPLIRQNLTKQGTYVSYSVCVYVCVCVCVCVCVHETYR